jgi:NADPH:quinone reductase
METMTALTAGPDGRPAPEEVPAPVAGPGEALVAVRAISLNRGELLTLGRPGARPGWDVAGELLQDAGDLAAGTRVVALVDGAGWADLVAVPLRRLAPVPDGLPLAQAAALPVAGLTALRAIRMGGSLLGRRVLVTGERGSVGRLAVQLAAMSGARVGEGGPYDLVVELVGGATMARALGELAPGGTLVSLAASDPEPVPYEPRTMFNAAPGARIVPWNVFDGTEPGGVRADLELLLALVAAGRLRVELAAERPWSEAAAAVDDLRARRVRGKVVLHR